MPTPNDVQKAYNAYLVAASIKYNKKKEADVGVGTPAKETIDLITTLNSKDDYNLDLRENVYPNLSELLERAKLVMTHVERENINHKRINKMIEISNRDNSILGTLQNTLYSFIEGITNYVNDIIKNLSETTNQAKIAPEIEETKEEYHRPKEGYSQLAKALNERYANIEGNSKTDGLKMEVTEKEKSVLKKFNSAKKGIKNFIGVRKRGAGKNKENKDTNDVDNPRKNR